MSFENIVDSFEKFDQSIQLLKDDIGYSYMEAMIESGENIIDDGQVQVQDGKPSPAIASELAHLYEDLGLDELAPSEIRQVIQLGIIRSIKEDYTQANHQMTPDSIGNFVGFLMQKFIKESDHLSIADLSVGTGNLLATVYYFLKDSYESIKLTGVDNDELLLSLASTSLTLQNLPVHLIYDDALNNLLIEPHDVIVSDLPVGYYPVDEKAREFELSSDQGHSLIHHLLIEQGMKYLKESGLAFYIVPEQIFETAEGSKLLDFIQEKGYFQGIVQLANEMFANEKAAKSILIFQKKGKNARQVDEVLLAKAPEFNKKEKMKEFVHMINDWAEKNLKEN